MARWTYGGGCSLCYMMTPMQPLSHRRHVLAGLGATALMAGPASRAFAARLSIIERLIADSRKLSSVAERLDFVSAGLRGSRYRANTLIGGPTHAERFVLRDDVFDCVTYCEAVLAAALARGISEFEGTLRAIRYHDGKVQYEHRNHYFADWCSRNVENGICRRVAIEPALSIDKIVSWHREFAPRKVLIAAVESPVFLKNSDRLLPGDIIGFTSKRVNLDFFHTGLVTFDSNGTLMLRHASRRHGLVIDESMAGFVEMNGVRSVTLLRAAAVAPGEARG
jgi:Protein of unknown function (DUF1460)